MSKWVNGDTCLINSENVDIQVFMPMSCIYSNCTGLILMNNINCELKLRTPLTGSVGFNSLE